MNDAQYEKVLAALKSINASLETIAKVLKRATEGEDRQIGFKSEEAK